MSIMSIDSRTRFLIENAEPIPLDVSATEDADPIRDTTHNIFNIDFFLDAFVAVADRLNTSHSEEVDTFARMARS